MHRKSAPRLTAALLCLLFLLLPPAQALTVEQARDLLAAEYVDPVPPAVLEQDTIASMLEALGDPYTEYFTPEQYQAYSASYEDSALVGIGVSSEMTAEGLRLAAVYADTPAAKGGLVPGEFIVAVDGKSTLGRTLQEVTLWMQGAEGTQVRLTLLRDGAERDVTLTRTAITLPTASAELVDGHIGYIQCSTFGYETAAHTVEALHLYAGEADRWILDLRNNGGGLINTAVDMLGTFTGPAVVGYIRTGAGEYGYYENKNDALTDKPLIVLTNGHSASASELFAAAIRDTGAGIAVGGRTYGKGVGQFVFDQENTPALFPDGDALKVTTFRYFSGRGTGTHTVGVIPHLLLSDRNAAAAAHLLSAAPPDGDTAGYLRLDLEHLWYIELEAALSEDYRDAFTELLEAIPSTVSLEEGTGSGWRASAPVTVATAHGLEYSSRGFTDADESRYGGQIDMLGTYGVVSGDGSGTFRPNDTLTRAQLCALLAQALNCNVPTGDSLFSDVDMGAWYGPSVNAVAAMGLVGGVGDGRFDPDGPVDHQQLIAVLGRLAHQLSMDFYEVAAGRPDGALSTPALSGYADWAREWVWLLTQGKTGFTGGPINLLWDDLDQIVPTAAATRGEAASLVYMVLFYTGLLPV